MLRRLAPGLAALVLLAAPLRAQSLRDQVRELFEFGPASCDTVLCLNPTVAPGSHGQHFITALIEGQNSILAFLTEAIGVSVANIPISGTSSGVTFTFEGGVPVKTSVSSGPIFGERAQTLGRGRVLLGGNLTAVNFQSLRGVPLPSVAFAFTHDSLAGTPPNSPKLGSPLFENEVFEVRPNFDFKLLVGALYVTYGLLDRVDVGLAVPLVHASLSGTSFAAVRPYGPGSPHYFGDDPADSLPTKQFQDTSVVEGSATGIGDVAARVKVNLKQTERSGISVLLDARFPTGKEEDFLGSGAFSMRGLGILSARWGDFSPHLNLGYFFTNAELQNDAVLATVGFDQLVAPWATLAADLITQFQVGESKLALPGVVVIDTPSVRRIETANIPEQRDHLINGSVGVKLTSGRGVTFVANTLFPFRKSGLQADVVFTAGFEYNF